MGSVMLIVGLFLGCLILLIQESESGCLCNAKGGPDFYNPFKGNGQLSLVPKHIRAPGYADLPPVGDSCWCNKQTVQPADQQNKLLCPKLREKHYEGCRCAQSSSNAAYYASEPGVPCSSCTGNAYNDHQDHHDSYASPADPVSVSLALRAGHARAVPEAKISYGFASKPVDDLKKITYSHVPEEQLFAFNTPVIQLKPTPKPEPELEYDSYEDDYEGNERPYFTYKQLGYVNENYKNPKFTKVSSAQRNYDGYPARIPSSAISHSGASY